MQNKKSTLPGLHSVGHHQQSICILPCVDVGSLAEATTHGVIHTIGFIINLWITYNWIHYKFQKMLALQPVYLEVSGMYIPCSGYTWKCHTKFSGHFDFILKHWPSLILSLLKYMIYTVWLVLFIGTNFSQNRPYSEIFAV